MDNDMVFIKHTDDLVRLVTRDNELVITYGSDLCTPAYGINGGFFVLYPHAHLMQEVLHFLRLPRQGDDLHKVFGGSDQSALAQYIRFVEGNENRRYQVLSHIYNHNANYCVCPGYRAQFTVAYHFTSSQKPFQTRRSHDQCEQPIRDLWWQHSDKVRNQFGVFMV